MKQIEPLHQAQNTRFPSKRASDEALWWFPLVRWARIVTFHSTRSFVESEISFEKTWRLLSTCFADFLWHRNLFERAAFQQPSMTAFITANTPSFLTKRSNGCFVRLSVDLICENKKKMKFAKAGLPWLIEQPVSVLQSNKIQVSTESYRCNLSTE